MPAEENHKKTSKLLELVSIYFIFFTKTQCKTIVLMTGRGVVGWMDAGWISKSFPLENSIISNQELPEHTGRQLRKGLLPSARQDPPRWCAGPGLRCSQSARRTTAVVHTLRTAC